MACTLAGPSFTCNHPCHAIIILHQCAISPLHISLNIPIMFRVLHHAPIPTPHLLTKPDQLQASITRLRTVISNTGGRAMEACSIGVGSLVEYDCEYRCWGTVPICSGMRLGCHHRCLVGNLACSRVVCEGCRNYLWLPNEAV